MPNNTGPDHSPAELQAAIALLREPETIRARCAAVLDAGERGGLQHFSVDLSRMDAVAAITAEVTRTRYPQLQVPIHSRLAHFDADGEPRVVRMRDRLSALPPLDRARALLEVVVISVLVDAGSGPHWKYLEPDSGKTCRRSEGLAVASLHWLASGALSTHGQPYAVDADRLADLQPEAFALAFQVSADNPLSGLDGRVSLLQRLAAVLKTRPDLFGPEARLGQLLDRLLAQRSEQGLPARTILATVLEALTPIWPSRHSLGEKPLGDVFPHPQAGGTGPSAGLVPFHKLSQWLSYSLVAPVQEAGVRVCELDALTGLAEYRNGGLLVDGGVLQARDPLTYRQAHAADSELIVEWRALTVALLERLWPRVTQALFGAPTSPRFPLAAMLEGGTWAAGRRLASERRADGGPPIAIASDGTVF